jgi:hypothetical protein
MTGSYKRILTYVTDAYEHVGNARNSRARTKPIDRRIKRREHHDIVREATASYYADAADDLYEFHLMEMEEQHAEYLDFLNEEDTQDFYDPYNDYIADDWPSYDDYDPYDDWYSSPISYEEQIIIQPEDAGKSLADILREALAAKGD